MGNTTEQKIITTTVTTTSSTTAAQQYSKNDNENGGVVRGGESPGCTALMYACQQGDVLQVGKLLKINPALARDKDRTLKTALHYCTEARTAQCADLVYRAAPDLINAADEDGLTPLHLAVIAGNIPLTNFLLANNVDVKVVDNEKHSVVHWATVCGETAALRAVLLAGAPVSTPDVHGGFPLHYAAQMCGAKDTISNSNNTTLSKNNPTTENRVQSAERDTSKLGLEILDTLLTFPGIRVNAEDVDGRQPLLWAASAGSAAAVLALVAAGSATEAADKDGLTALHCAASRGHADCLEALLTMCGVSPDIIDTNGCTALHYAVTLGHADCTALLLAHGAKVNRQDRRGRTPAHCGCAKGQVETVRMLGAHNADLWVRSARGDLPLHEASSAGRKQLVRWLLTQRPSQVNAKNNDGRTPLHFAALNDNTDVCKILLDHGANVNAVMRTSKNVLMTPLDCALKNGYRSTAKYLQLNGGLPFQRLRLPISSEGGINVQFQNDITIQHAKQVPLNSNSEDDLFDDNYLSRKSQKRRVYKHRRKLQVADAEDESRINHELSKGQKKSHLMKTDIDVSSSSSGSLCSINTKIQPVRRVKTKTKEIQTDERFLIIPIENSELAVQHEQPVIKTEKLDEKLTKQIDNSVQKFPIDNLPSLTDSNISDTNSMDHVKVAEVLVHANQDDNDLTQNEIVEHENVETEQDVIKPEQLTETNEDLESESKQFEGQVDHEEKDIVAEDETKLEVAEEIKEAKESTEEQIVDNIESNDQIEGKRTEIPPDEPNNEEIDGQIEEHSNTENISQIEKEIDAAVDETETGVEQNEGVNEIIEDEVEIIDSETVHEISNENTQLGEEIEENEQNIDDNAEVLEENKIENIDENIDTTDLVPDNEKVVDENEKKIDEETVPLDADQNENVTGIKELTEDGIEEDVVEAKPLEQEEIEKDEIPQEELNETGEKLDELDKNFQSFQVLPDTTPEKPTDISQLDVETNKKHSLKFKQKESKKSNKRKDTEISLNSSKQKVKKDSIIVDKSETKLSPKNDDIDEEFDQYSSFVSDESIKENEDVPPDTETKLHMNHQILESTYSDESDLDHESYKRNEARKRRSKIRSKSAGKDSYNSDGQMLDSGFEPSPRNSRIPRRKCSSKPEINMTTVTQTVQGNIRRYHLERKIFQHLLELKRLQIRSGQSNEAVLVKRAIDEYHRSILTTVGAGRYKKSDYTFKSFEKFLYDSLRKLQKGHVPPHLVKLPETAPSPLLCTHSTMQCDHATHAYTGIPCAAYITKLNHHTIPKVGFGVRPGGFLPKLSSNQEHPPQHVHNNEQRFLSTGSVTLELTHGDDKQFITLPTDRLNQNKKYFVTFTVKGLTANPNEDNTTAASSHRHAKSC